MTDYKTHLEKFVSDIYKKFDEEKEKRDSLKIIDRNYEKIQKQLDELVNRVLDAQRRRVVAVGVPPGHQRRGGELIAMSNFDRAGLIFNADIGDLNDAIDLTE